MKILKSFCLALCVLSSGMDTADAAFIDGVNLGGGFMWNDSIRPRFESAGGIALHTSVHANLPGSINTRAVLRHKFCQPGDANSGPESQLCGWHARL